MFPSDKALCHWIEMASEKVSFQGLPSRICWLGYKDRAKFGLKLNEMPRNGAKIRLRNRCEVSGRPRGYYRKFKMSRIALRDLGSAGQVPGLVKSSW